MRLRRAVSIKGWFVVLASALVLSNAVPAFMPFGARPLVAQGIQTGTIAGIVGAGDEAPLPGTRVTVTSPALQGERSTTTDAHGAFAVRGLPAGAYRIRFEQAGYQPALSERVDVNLGATVELAVSMSMARAEAVTVIAQAPQGISSLSSVTANRTVTKAQVDILPMSRRPVDIAEFTPGLTNNTYTAGQLAISGAFGFDNVFMVDGVDTNDTIFGTANNLYIEDAVQDTAVLTSGISPEYGRFSGGVVNVVTKSGGNIFGGSVRENLSNPQWITQTPRERQNNISHNDDLNKVHEGTVGGPLLRDRLWFFTAGRYERTTVQNTFAQTGGVYLRKDTNKRGELKLTAAVRPGWTGQVSYINNSSRQENTSALPAATLVDPSTLFSRRLPNRLLAANFNGVVGQGLFATVQYSEKKQQFLDNGGTRADLQSSPFLTLGGTAGVPGGLFYHAPYLDANDPESRNNRQVTGSVAFLLSRGSLGTHDVKVGGEYFVSQGIGGNSQSPTGYVFATDYAVQNGRPVLDANGSPIPRFIPGLTEVWNYQATRGASIDIATISLYARDRWTATPRLTLDLGMRVEAVTGSATGDITTVDTSSIVPRLGAAYDLRGDGRTTIQATYSHYSGKYNQQQFSANTNVGRPSEVDYAYAGPAGQGADFAPGFDLRNYQEVTYANFPTANVKTADGLHAPITRELTIGAARRLAEIGVARVTYVQRRAVDLIDDFTNLSTGTTVVPLIGTLTNRVYDNTDDATREYKAMMLEGSYRVSSSLDVGGHYTMQIRNHGNFAGEAVNQPTSTTFIGDFPEIFGAALDRLAPDGRLDSFQRHKLRLYGTWHRSLGRLGSVDLAPIWRVNSGLAYSLTAPIGLRTAQLQRNPGYPANDINPSVRETIYFGARGENSYKGSGVVDLAITYGIPAWKSAAPWFKVEVYNAFKNEKQIAWDRTVTANTSGPLDSNGIPTTYVKGPRFGQATSDNQFPQPYPGQNGGRAIRMAFGIRF